MDKEAKIKILFPDDVETITMTKEDYDRNVEQLVVDKCKAELEIERLNNKINKALEIIELMKPELWNISNKMTYRLIDIKNVLEEKE